jgi:predicted PurR-regulated permease PerM
MDLFMKFNLKYLLALIPIIAVGSIIYYFSEIVTYILSAWVLSMIGAPVVVFLRKYIGKNLSAIATLSLFIIGFLLIVWTVIPPLVNQIDNLSKVDYNKVVSALEEPIRDWEKWLVRKKLMLENDNSGIRDTVPEEHNSAVIHSVVIDSTVSGFDQTKLTPLSINITLNNEIKENPVPVQKENEQEDFFNILKQNISTYLNPVKLQSLFGNTLNAFGNIFIGVLSVFFIAFFFLREQGLFDNILTSLVPVGYENHTKQAVDETSKLLIRYFIGVLTQMIIITIIVSVGLTAFGVKNALLIAFFAALMNIIPYIGPIIGLFFAVILTLSSNTEIPFYTEMIPLLFRVIGVFAVMQLIDNVLLQPIIFAKSVKAHPLEIFIVVLVGAKIGGISGMVLAIPFYTAFRVISKVFLSEFKVIQKLTRNM